MGSLLIIVKPDEVCRTRMRPRYFPVLPQSSVVTVRRRPETGLKVTGAVKVRVRVPAVTLYLPSVQVTTAVAPPGMSSFAAEVYARNVPSQVSLTEDRPPRRRTRMTLFSTFPRLMPV